MGAALGVIVLPASRLSRAQRRKENHFPPFSVRPVKTEEKHWITEQGFLFWGRGIWEFHSMLPKSGLA
jgi:hypothetical protein